MRYMTYYLRAALIGLTLLSTLGFIPAGLSEDADRIMVAIAELLQLLATFN
mgnify:CR=1 FL=1